jgi:DNA-binding NarL/FixJ family response regulator
MIRVLLCDDHRIVREGLRQVLADDADIMVCGEARTGTEALAQVQALMGAAPQGDRTGLDVVLLDIAMPERDGLDVLQVMRREYPGLPVLMLSTYPEKQYAVRCIQLVRRGYLHKSADPDDMVAAVRKVAGGGRYLTDATAEALAGAVGAPGWCVRGPGRH